MSNGTRRTVALAADTNNFLEKIRVKLGLKTDTAAINECVRFREQFLDYSEEEIAHAIGLLEQTKRYTDAGLEMQFVRPEATPTHPIYVMSFLGSGRAAPQRPRDQE
jgi:hypothetical protein